MSAGSWWIEGRWLGIESKPRAQFPPNSIDSLVEIDNETTMVITLAGEKFLVDHPMDDLATVIMLIESGVEDPNDTEPAPSWP